MRRSTLTLATMVLTPWALLSGAQSSGPLADLEALLVRVGASIERYYSRAESVVCTETVSVRSLASDLMPDRSPLRRLTYELHVAWDRATAGGVPEPSVQRELIRVNNRAPRPKDKPACTDPSEISPDSLELLLPAKQLEYTFSMAGRSKVRGRSAIMLDYRPRTRPGPISVSARDGVEDCWHVDMPSRTKGRVWIDEETTDVLRLDEHLSSQVDVELPHNPRRAESGGIVTFERLDSSTVYRAVTFAEPDETIMLPASVESISIVRNSGAPRMRTSTTFSNYRRFTTGGRIVEEP